eukprot:GHVP01050701.1.p1 GENE.GHVP01050701.1~~GHVP01050701.1.p1  ORF type:complete len:457 (-),score=49.67 GHVP01050701.1:663-2033(-)
MLKRLFVNLVTVSSNFLQNRHADIGLFMVSTYYPHTKKKIIELTEYYTERNKEVYVLPFEVEKIDQRGYNRDSDESSASKKKNLYLVNQIVQKTPAIFYKTPASRGILLFQSIGYFFLIKLNSLSPIEPFLFGDGWPFLTKECLLPFYIGSITNCFKTGKLFNKIDASTIIEKTISLFQSSNTLENIDYISGRRMTVCGDLHGQFYDLLKIFEINGPPSENSAYLFNGDLVDRGFQSVEIVLLISLYKIIYPSSVFIARGNHEIDSVNQRYGFSDEVKYKYDVNILSTFRKLFSVLPIAHIVHKRIIVIHGGLPCKDLKLEEITCQDRTVVGPRKSLIEGLLWSDPCENEGLHKSRRGAGCLFGPDITHSFLKRNKLCLLIRSHEVKKEGYQLTHGNKCLTVFSAPNYGGRINLGAYISIQKDCKYKINRFNGAYIDSKTNSIYNKNIRLMSKEKN